MSKKLVMLLLCSLFFVALLYAETITGNVEEISSDSSYMIVNGQKIQTNFEFIDDAMFVVGDKVQITTEDGKAVSFKYLDLE